MAESIYEDLEDAIVGKLAPLKDRIEIQAMPDNEADLKKAFKLARVSIMYHSNKSSPQLSNAGSLSIEGSFVQAMIESRARRGAMGILHVKTLLEPLINGLIVPGWTAIYPHTFEYHQRGDGVWVYNWLLKTDAVSHQVSENYIGVNLDIWP